MAIGTPATVELWRLGIAFTAHEFTAESTGIGYGLEAAAALGVEADRVFKTLLAEVDGTGLVVGIVPVSGSLDLKALAAAAGGKRATMADPALAERRTGYVVGGISPIGQRTRLPSFIDETVELWETVFVSGGRRGLDLELAPADLLAATGARLADIARG